MYFQPYLYRIGKAAAANCLYCLVLDNNAKHMLSMNVTAGPSNRRQLEMELGHVTLDTTVETMVQGEEQWGLGLRYPSEEKVRTCLWRSSSCLLYTSRCV